MIPIYLPMQSIDTIRTNFTSTVSGKFVPRIKNTVIAVIHCAAWLTIWSTTVNSELISIKNEVITSWACDTSTTAVYIRFFTIQYIVEAKIATLRTSIHTAVDTCFSRIQNTVGTRRTRAAR